MRLQFIIEYDSSEMNIQVNCTVNLIIRPYVDLKRVQLFSTQSESLPKYTIKYLNYLILGI